MSGQELITLIVAMFASTGFWTFCKTVYEHRCEKKKAAENQVSFELVNSLRKALLGVMHSIIFSLGNDYVARGEITLDEYDNFMVLYRPYSDLGGNGTGKKLMLEVEMFKIIEDDDSGK